MNASSSDSKVSPGAKDPLTLIDKRTLQVVAGGQVQRVEQDHALGGDVALACAASAAQQPCSEMPKTSSVVALAFPDSLDPPTQFAQYLRLALVARSVVANLVVPIGGVRLCADGAVRAVVAMPEAAMNENNCATAQEYQIGSAR